jgi:molybdate transport system ATP-binding protein
LVLIARAMIKHPPLLILDEALINLDNQGTAIFVSLIHKIVSKSDTTIFFVSHGYLDNLLPNCVYELVLNKNGSLGTIKECV